MTRSHGRRFSGAVRWDLGAFPELATERDVSSGASTSRLMNIVRWKFVIFQNLGPDKQQNSARGRRTIRGALLAGIAVLMVFPDQDRGCSGCAVRPIALAESHLCRKTQPRRRVNPTIQCLWFAKRAVRTKRRCQKTAVRQSRATTSRSVVQRKKSRAPKRSCKSTDCRLFEAVVVIVNYSEC